MGDCQLPVSPVFALSIAASPWLHLEKLSWSPGSVDISQRAMDDTLAHAQKPEHRELTPKPCPLSHRLVVQQCKCVPH